MAPIKISRRPERRDVFFVPQSKDEHWILICSNLLALRLRSAIASLRSGQWMFYGGGTGGVSVSVGGGGVSVGVGEGGISVGVAVGVSLGMMMI
jgi:hypothetical protein